MIVLGCAFSFAHAQEAPLPEDLPAATAAASEAVATTATTVLTAVSEMRTRLETGIASWYGKRFHGRRTASGESFDMHALTAAHPNLPFGSWVRVRNVVNGLSVDVRINDRGPHVKRRIIDLSRAAARSLGLLDDGSGTSEVSITLLRR
jgi:rare lipoprotein A